MLFLNAKLGNLTVLTQEYFHTNIINVNKGNPDIASK